MSISSPISAHKTYLQCQIAKDNNLNKKETFFRNVHFLGSFITASEQLSWQQLGRHSYGIPKQRKIIPIFLSSRILKKSTTKKVLDRSMKRCLIDIIFLNNLSSNVNFITKINKDGYMNINVLFIFA